MDDIELTVVIPAYNEEATVESTVREITAYLANARVSHEILVVDDGSRDSTLSILQSLTEEIAELRVCHYAPNRGKGCAVRTGMLAAKGAQVLFTDSDNSTPIDELPAFMSALDDGSQVAIASREVMGAVRVIHQPFYRELGGKALNLLVRLLAVPGILDTQCGFKLFTREAAQSIFTRCSIDRFSFDVEALCLARQLGYKIAELPVHWTHHQGSRVSPLRDGLRMLADIARIRTRNYELEGGPDRK